MKKIICLAVVATCIFCLFSCGSKFDPNYEYDGHSLVGIWCEEDYSPSEYYTYEFTAENTMILRYYHYGILFDNSVGSLTIGKNVFTVTYENYDGSKTYVENKFCITEDGELVMVYLSKQNDMEEMEAIYIPYEMEYNKENPLLGTWENTAVEDELWIFDEEFVVTMPNEIKTEKMAYSVNNNKLYLLYMIDPGEHKLYSDTPIIFTFDIEGDTLTLDGDIDYTFKKK